jgi:predicted anti-sigma-YlaC factor YlaD
METICKKVKQHWHEYMSGTCNDQTRHDIEQHLKTCAGCRAFAYEQRFTLLMQEAFKDSHPEPSEEYFSALRQKLARSMAVPETSIAELLAEQCWRLVPVLALLLVFIVASLSYQYAQIEPMAQPLEESVVFGDTAPTEQTILGAIISEETNHGQ